MSLTADHTTTHSLTKRSVAMRVASLTKRALALTVATVLAMLLLTSALPPLVADQSDRAIVNAPVTLITSPIAGDVKSLTPRAGEGLAANAPIAEIVNSRVDRSTLVVLEGELSDTSAKIYAIRAKIESDDRYVAAISAVIAATKTAVEARYAQQIAELQGEVSAASAAVHEKQSLLARQDSMVARHVASPTMAQVATEQYAGAESVEQGMEAKLEEKRAELASAHDSIFVGDDVQQVAILVQKKRDMELDSQKLAIEEDQLSAVLKTQTTLVKAERSRVATLERSTVQAPAAGEVLFVSASVDRHVNAGDTLARLVDCDKSFVAGIFSYRQGVNFAPGTRVTIDRGGAEIVSGSVMAVLPKTSDKVDEDYALPLPQTERRELYVLVRPDHPLRRPQSGATPSPGTAGSCDIGAWVTLSRDGGWMPSTSVFWRRAADDVQASAAWTWHGLEAASNGTWRQVEADAPVAWRWLETVSSATWHEIETDAPLAWHGLQEAAR
jgi:multidrug resistance efflux pump